MKAATNKRNSLRYQSNPELVFQFSLFAEKYEANCLDHSEEGISFYSSKKITPGTIVFIRRNPCMQSGIKCEDCRGCKTITFATVKWCTKDESLETEQYKIGARYLHAH